MPRASRVGGTALQNGFFIALLILVSRAVRALPLRAGPARELLRRFSETSHATIKGTIVTGAAQGALGGVFFWLLGLPVPALWGVLMAVLSVVPAVGPAVIWGPAALWLLLDGAVARGLILTVAGVGGIGIVDNLLRPLLVGRATRVPDFLVLLATLGGLTVFGVSGFVIGPILAAFFLSLWGMVEQEFRRAPGRPAGATESPELTEIGCEP